MSNTPSYIKVRGDDAAAIMQILNAMLVVSRVTDKMPLPEDQYEILLGVLERLNDAFALAILGEEGAS